VTRIRTVLLIASAALALGACSHSVNDKAASSGADAASATTVGPGAAAVNADTKVPKGQALTASRQIVYTAHLQVRVTDVDAASNHATTIVDGVGGYLFSQDANLQGQADETVVFKVPPADFPRVLEQLAGLGTPLEKTVATNDVTDQVVDLQGRLDTAEASAQRLRALFTNAGNVNDIVTIENDLESRESEVESLQGQLRLVKNQVQLATVTLTLTTRGAPHVTKSKPPPGFTRALSAGWKAFAASVRVALTVVGATLPFVGFAGLVAGIVVFVRRRRHRPVPLDPQGSPA
jgi:Domain of unknown function (DUF4349)